MLPSNERIKLSKNFFLDEFLNPVLYGNLIKDRYLYWQNLANTDIDRFYKEFLNGDKLKKLVSIAQFIRDKYAKPVTINNWAKGGDRINSGVRDLNCSIGAPYSAHKKWEAIDMIVEGISESKIYKDVLSDQYNFMSVGVTEIENGTWNNATGEGWTHLSIRKTGLPSIKIIPYWVKK